MEIIWRTSTTREVKTIFSVASTCIKLVRYTERGRALDRACRLGEPKMDLLPHLLRELIAEVEKDKGTSGEQLLIRHMVSFRQKYTYRPKAKQAQASQETQDYMEHHYLGGE